MRAKQGQSFKSVSQKEKKKKKRGKQFLRKFKVYLNSTDYTECEPKQTTKRKSANKQFVSCLNEIWGYSEVIIIKKEK